MDSALLSELGEKLVESVHVALLELVRNSYDADATEAEVRILLDEKGEAQVDVSDNGSGMTLEDVRRYWMRIATTNKRENDVSPRFGRPRAGSKGIGRFSCRRLGLFLSLHTVAETSQGEYEETRVTFDWQAFTPGTEVTKISCPAESKRIRSGVPGTTLTIRNPSADEWSRRGFGYLKRHLAVLVANRGARRPGYEEDPGFRTRLVAPHLDDRETVTDLRESLISAGWGTVTASIDPHGRAHCELDALGIGKRQITSSREFPHLQGVSLKFGVLYDRKEQMRDRTVLSQGTLKSILPVWGGIYVRHKGLRVYPYGDAESEDDWLDIEKDRAIRRGPVPGGSPDLLGLARSLEGVNEARVLLSLLSFRNYVGDVDIGPSAHGFEMKANREGFVENAASHELKEFVRFAVNWATIYRDYHIRLQAQEKSENARKELEGVADLEVPEEEVVKKAAAFLSSAFKSVSASLPTEEKQRTQKTVRAAIEAIQHHDSSQQRELAHLRLIASTSTLLLVFSHEVKSFIGRLESVCANLEAIEGKVESDSAARLRDMAKGLQNTKQRFIELLDMTSLIAGDPGKSAPIHLALASRIQEAIKCFRLITEAYGIQIQTEGIPRNLKVGPMYEAEFYAIALNALSNSIKSVIAAGGQNRIQIEVERKQGQAVIHIRDTGIGLPPEHFEDVFVPFVADPEGKLYPSLTKHLNPQDDYIVGNGTGLGLSIVRDIVRARSGQVRFVTPRSGWSAELEITLPRQGVNDAVRVD